MSTSLGVQTSAHTSLGAYTSAHTRAHMSLGAHKSAHTSSGALTSAHISACMCAFCRGILFDQITWYTSYTSYTTHNTSYLHTTQYISHITHHISRMAVNHQYFCGTGNGRSRHVLDQHRSAPTLVRRRGSLGSSLIKVRNASRTFKLYFVTSNLPCQTSIY